MVMGSSAGRFQGATHIVIGPTPVQIEKADFDRDGNLDLAILSIGTDAAAGLEYSQTIHVLPGEGNGQFTSPYVIALRGISDPNARFSVGDFNGDSWPDLALLEPALGRIRLAVNSSDSQVPRFQESPTAIAAGTGARCIASGDYSGDAIDDCVVGSSSQDGSKLTLLITDATGTVTTTVTASLPCAPTCLAAVRIDPAAALDAAFGGSGDASAGVLLGDGAGQLNAALDVRISGEPSEIAVGDLNGDGLTDLVLVEPAQNILGSTLARGSSTQPRFIRGDGNADGTVDISDGVKILMFLFVGETIDCEEAADTNDDSGVDVSDVIYLLEFLFRGGPQPKAPFPAAGENPGEHALACGQDGAGV